MIKNIIESIEQKFNKVLKFSKQSFVSSTLKDSETVVEYSTEIGGEATVASGSGSEPLGDGEHELSNGITITVKDGKVESINQPEIIEELAKEDEESAEEKSEDETKVEEVIEDAEPEAKKDEEEKENDIEISLETEDEPAEEEKTEDELKAEIEKLKAEIEKLKEGFSAVPTNESLEKFKAEFIADLTATLKNTPAQSFTAVVTEKEEDRFLAMARASKRNKN